MAESVNNQPLSAVTEGHNSSTLASSASTAVAAATKDLRRKNSKTKRQNKGLNSSNSRSKGKTINAKAAAVAAASLTSVTSKNRTGGRESRRKKRSTSSNSARCDSYSSDISPVDRESPSSRTRFNRKRGPAQNFPGTDTASQPSLEKKRRENSVSNSAHPTKSSSCENLSTAFSASVSSLVDCGGDCIAHRTRSRTKRLGDFIGLDNNTGSHTESLEPVLSRSHNPEKVEPSVPIVAREQGKNNLLNYYRKTRGNRDISKKLNTPENVENSSSTSSFELKGEEEKHNTSDKSPNKYKHLYKSKDNKNRVALKKPTSHPSTQWTSTSTKVDKNHKLYSYLAAARDLRSLKYKKFKIGGHQKQQYQQLLNYTSGENFGSIPSTSSLLSYSIAVGGGAVPKKRQKVGDNSAEVFYTSSTETLSSASGAVGQSGAATTAFLSGSGGNSYNSAPVPNQTSSSATTTTGYSKAPNLGARLARGGGAGRDAPHPQQQQQQSSLQAVINQNYHAGIGGGANSETLLQSGVGSLVVHQASNNPSSSSSHILRRSSRGKTGSCVSSSTAQGSGSGVTAASTSSAGAGTSSRTTHYHHYRSGGAVSSTHSSGKSSGGGGKHYNPSSVGGPSTSSQISATAAAVVASDATRPSGADTTNINPNVKIHKSSLAPPSGSLDVSNLHTMAQQPTGTTSNSNGVQPPTGTAGSVSNAAAHPDSESDDSEVGRLQALLEARGLPPHLFGALGPRMTHILHRTIGAGSSSKAQQLLQGLQSHDESQQLQAAIEMCQMLVMGNEDTLAGFPIKQVVPALINLLRMEHNFDIMNNACRALAYMLEALPRSSTTVVDAVPVFLEKLQVIQCMDVAEQSLTALEILSRRHNKAILQANGVSACLTYLDFFSINAQRAALAITANCCLNLHPEEFHFVRESLPLLARLLSQQDKKCVESVCTAFYRLVESFQHDPNKLQEIASKELLKNCQQLLVVTPSVLNSGTFTNVVRMLSVMCGNCPDLAISLLKNDIASTLLYLLTGSAEPSQSVDVELISRSPPELYEITCLIGELMPRLPTDGIFSVDILLERPNLGTQDQVQWQWRDDRGTWHSYSAIDSRMIEAAHMNSDDEISLSTLGRTYTVDFHSMQQINEDTGTTRPVQRKINTNFVPTVSTGQDLSAAGLAAIQSPGGEYDSQSRSIDARIACLREERGLASEFIKNLFSVLYEVYSSSAGPAVRYKCLRALLRMVYYASADLLKDVLKNQIVSSHIAGMMASNDLRIVVGALQMAEILMQKLPEVFGTHFRREGVIHQISQLADPNNPICSNPIPKQQGSGTLSAPPSASSLPANPFDFDSSVPSTSKGHSSQMKNLGHAINVLNTKMSMSMPSTSSTSLQMPSTSSSALAISLGGTPPSHIGTETQPPMASSLPSNGNFFMYSTPASDPRQYNNHYHHHHPAHFQPHQVDMISSAPPVSDNHSTPTTSSSAPIPNKMTDMLKRKVPPKRKSQSSGRSKSRQEESVVQELINRATAIGSGSSGRNTPSSSGSGSRSRFGNSSTAGSSTKSSFLSSLNPARWGRQGSHHSSFAKDSNSTNSSGLSKSTSNANLIAAGNREKARQWIRDQAISFINRYTEQEITKSTQSTPSVLTRLSAVIQKLDGNAEDCLDALQELKNILIESDISPFEVNHSGLIKAMLTFMTSEHGIVPRDNRLRAFLHVFAGLPLNPITCPGAVPTVQAAPFSAFVAKLNGCVTQLEQFPVKVHDFPAGPGGRSNQSALKFFNTHQLKCNLQRHPDCTNLRQWKGGIVKIDPLALVQAIERYLVVRGYGGIRGDSEDDSEEDMDDNVAAVVLSQGGLKHKLQFLIGDHVLPYNMTVYQAVKQFSPLVNDQSETDTDTETPIGNASIWVQQHTIYYRPIEDDHVTGAGSSKGTSSTTSKKSSKTYSSSKMMRKKTEFWQEGIVPNINSALTPFLISSLPTDIVTVQDASLDALCMLRIINSLNRHWESLYGCVVHEHLIPQAEFIHSKITAKANRQLQDPLVIMTGNLPTWLQQIAMACPFLFPFETRHLLFYAISFDRDRALQRLLDTTPDLNSSDTSERVTPRLDRRKRAISREDILKQAEHIIQDFGHSKALLEIQYDNEVGTGLGPTLEFYALVSAELQRCDLGLWNGSDSYKQNSSSVVDVVKSGIAQIDDAANESGVNNRNSGVVAANNSLNQPNLDSSAYLAQDNALNMIIEQTDYIHLPPTNITPPPVPVNQSVAVTYVNAPHGLFPIPLGKAAKLSQISRVKSKFKFLGKFIAKAVMDSRMLDLPFSIPFYRWLLTEETSLSLADLISVAPEVQTTLVRLQDIVKQRDLTQNDPNSDAMEKTEKIESLDLDGCLIADLGLDFVLPGHANIELRRGGRDIPVTIHNLHQYIALVTHWFLVEGVQRQFEALREGFDTVFPSHRLRIFYPEELENVFCGTGASNYQRWDIRMLQECCRTDHGFTQDSQAIQHLYEILSSYNRDEQRLFLQFVTGSPRLPTGGFKSLTPPLTIVRKTLDSNQNPNEYLPSVMTCVNYLKLPDYSSREVMRLKLKVAASEGSMSFHLS